MALCLKGGSQGEQFPFPRQKLAAVILITDQQYGFGSANRRHDTKRSAREVALKPEGHEHHSTGSGTGTVEHHQATAAETFTLSRSATDTSTDGGSNKCWCLHFVQVTASVILKMAC